MLRVGSRLGLGAVAATVSLVMMTAGAGPAAAHPLGNFTLNRYARVEVSAGVVRVYYVIDLAEIPSYQVRKLVDADAEGYLDREVAAVIDGLELELDGRAVGLRAVGEKLTRPRGEGGMRRVRIDAVLEASFPPTGPDEVIKARFADGNQPERIGWREIVVVAAGDATLVESSAPDTDAADELRDYPAALLQDPIDVRAATFRYRPGSQAAPATGIGEIDATSGRGDRFTNLLGRQDLSPLVVGGMLVVAALAGGGHALAPGHGKTVMAAYLVGTKGRPVDAVLLGLIVSAMHTTSVLVVGVGLLQVDRSFALDRIYPALTVASGAGVLVVGCWLTTLRLRTVQSEDRRIGRRGALHQHDHGRDAHRDHHGHGNGDHGHALPADVSPLSRRGLALLAAAGGIVPSPSAVIVLVGAFSVGRIALGLGLVLTFSIGLAATLTAVGLAFVLGRHALGDQPSVRLTRHFPVLGAMALLPLGLVLVVQGVRGLAA